MSNLRAMDGPHAALDSQQHKLKVINLMFYVTFSDVCYELTA